MAVGTPTVGFAMSPTLDSWIAESDTLTGPYRLVQYLSKFGNQAYNPNMPSRFWNGGWNSTGCTARNFDIIWTDFSRISQLHTARHAAHAVLYFVPVRIGS